MIYVATIHWLTDKWIDIQRRYLETYINEEFRTFAFLNELPNNHSDKFYYASTERISSHGVKLNLLADLIIQNSENDDDWIIFMDGDAFPIANIVNFGRERLKQYPLVAIRRDEEDGEKHPHPCFCMTTVKFWKEVKGDWKMGYKWTNNNGMEISDTGGNLLGILERNNIDWYPLLRTNKKNLHEVSFGLYGDLIYHHGAGFRTPTFRIVKKKLNPLHVLFQKLYRKILPASIRFKVPIKLRQKYRADSKFRLPIQQLSDEVYKKIRDDFYFYKFF